MTRQSVITKHYRKETKGVFKGYFYGYLKITHYIDEFSKCITVNPENKIHRLTPADALLDAQTQYDNLM